MPLLVEKLKKKQLKKVKGADYLDPNEDWEGQVIRRGTEFLGFWAQSRNLGEQYYMKCDNININEKEKNVIGIGNCKVLSCAPSIEQCKGNINTVVKSCNKCKSWELPPTEGVKLQNVEIDEENAFRRIQDLCESEDTQDKAYCDEPKGYSFFAKF